MTDDELVAKLWATLETPHDRDSMRILMNLVREHDSAEHAAQLAAARAEARLEGLREAKQAAIDAMVGKPNDTPLVQVADVTWRAIQRLINAAEDAIESAAPKVTL